MSVNKMINELKDLYKWLYDNCKKDFINAKKNNLIYSYSSFEKLEKKLNDLLTDTNSELKPYITQIHFHNNTNNFYEYIQSLKDEYVFITSTKSNSYNYTTRILSWYSIQLEGIKNMIIHQSIN